MAKAISKKQAKNVKTKQGAELMRSRCGFKLSQKLRVRGRLVNKGDMKMLEEFVKAGYV